jgi:plasmid stability protein
MGEFTINDIDELTMEQLREPARRNGRSIEDEVVSIPEEAAGPKSVPDPKVHR